MRTDREPGPKGPGLAAGLVLAVALTVLAFLGLGAGVGIAMLP